MNMTIVYIILLILSFIAGIIVGIEFMKANERR